VSAAAVVVSPHFDDAVLSLAGLLTRWGAAATVLTALGGRPAGSTPASDWDRACGFDDAATAAATRAGEDRTACARLGFTPVHLGGLDRAYRDRTGDDLAELPGALAGVAGGTPVLLPAGIGGHPDHIRVRDAALAALRAAGHEPVYLYADLPYAANLWHWDRPESDRLDGPAALAAIAALADRPAAARLDRVRLSTAEWAAKRNAVWAYASQLAPLSMTVRGLMFCPGPLQTEAVWRIY
jgi:LmbE family N-acetylglucosaminyl deacetylase